MQRVLQHDFGSSVAKVLSTTTRNKGKKWKIGDYTWKKLKGKKGRRIKGFFFPYLFFSKL